jgi:predicted ATP-binding protein involved in virulence
MQVKRLQINAFRGIEALDLEFRPGANVFIGVNGVGKSSILDCLATLAFIYTDGFRKKSLNPLPSDDQIKFGYDTSHIAIVCAIDNLDLRWRCDIKRQDDRAIDFLTSHTTVDSDLGMEQLSKLVRRTRQAFEEDPDSTNLPLGIYYPTTRIIPTDPFSKKNAGSNHRDFHRPNFLNIQALDGKLDFTEFFTWFKEREDLENETRLETNPDHRDRQLKAIRNAIPIFLPGFSHLRIKRSPLRMVVTKNGQELIISQLSDGEKSLLTIIGDIARRLAICNPALDNPLEGEGIILIDEIDAHLHPKWQRGIIPKLEHTFPNCQFFIATHSPQIISDVKSENIYLLQQDDAGEVIAVHPEGTYGRDTNQILEDVMGVSDRPEWSKQDLQQLFRLIDSGDLPAARDLKNQLESAIGIDEPEFTKADVLIRRKEILGR